MIEDGWPYIWGAYAVTVGAFSVLAAVVVLRLRYWAARARELDASKLT